jgi:hypothetical protein
VIHILSCLQGLSPQCKFSLSGAALGIYLYGQSSRGTSTTVH